MRNVHSHPNRLFILLSCLLLSNTIQICLYPKNGDVYDCFLLRFEWIVGQGSPAQNCVLYGSSACNYNDICYNLFASRHDCWARFLLLQSHAHLGLFPWLFDIWLDWLPLSLQLFLFLLQIASVPQKTEVLYFPRNAGPYYFLLPDQSSEHCLCFPLRLLQSNFQGTPWNWAKSVEG